MRRIRGLLFLIALFINPILNAQVSFKNEGSYSIVVDEDRYVLPPLLKAKVDEDGNLFYCDMQMVLKFNPEGVFEKKISPIGRGPGEFEVLIDCDISENYLVVFPFNQFKVIYFNLKDLSFSHEVNVRNIRSRNLAPLNDSTFFLLSDVEREVTKPAISQFGNLNSRVLKERPIKDTPPMAYVGNTTDGGGIVTDNQYSVYYTYVSYPSVWKYDVLKGETRVFEDTPEYFEKSSIEELNRLKEPNNHLYYGGYMYTKSRTTDLFIFDQSLVLQTIDVGNPWETGSYDRDKVIKYIEVWKDDGEKLHTGLEAPMNLQLAFTLKELMYFKTKTAFSEAASKLNKGDRLTLFEIYSLQLNN